MSKIYILVLFLVITILPSFMLMEKKKIAQRVLNPDLLVIKPSWQGNFMINKRFVNDTVSDEVTFGTFLKWRLSHNPQKEEKKRDDFRPNVVQLDPSKKALNKIIWLGHATFLISINDVTFITDPAFFDLPTRERRVSLPCDVTDLTGIDYLLISHDHRDHFDAKSVNQLVALNPEMKALMPLNGSQLLKANGFDEISFQEAGWYQEYQLNENLRVIFLPARHWGRRGLNDQNRVLWGSFLILSGATKIYFGGDSGYGEHFKEIRELFGEINYCILPIGAYSPSYMMKTSHTTPEEAFQAFIDLGGETFIPMHYGTYDLSDEPAGEPLQRLKNEARRLNISDKLKVLDIGEALSVNQGTESLEIVGYLNQKQLTSAIK